MDVKTDSVTLMLGDCLERMRELPDGSVDSVVTDPPYGLGFMGNKWDRELPAVEIFQECLRVLKPGGHLLAFGGARTYHRLAVAVEDAGFEIRDQIMWVYGSGFPKSQNVSKAIDKAAGAERRIIGTGKGRTGAAAQPNGGSSFSDDKYQWPGEFAITAPATDAAQQWDGWGTALKPAHEPIVVARKPFKGTVAANVVAHGTGALNIDGCRVPTSDTLQMGKTGRASEKFFTRGSAPQVVKTQNEKGRFPANLIHDGSEEVIALFPETKSGALSPDMNVKPSTGWSGGSQAGRVKSTFTANEGSAARFFYCAKASRRDRHEGLGDPGPQFVHGATLREVENTATKGNNHPTVKPTDLMAYLLRLVTPPDGVSLDPFMGSGSTGKAAMREGFCFIGIELDTDYFAIARQRILGADPSPDEPMDDLI